jgi:circadian clock protein KaiC
MTSPAPRADQRTTGVEGLDRLTRGGLRPGALYVVLGAPGAGKTILAHQMAAAELRRGGTALYLTALTESHQSIIAQAASLRFFDRGWVGDRLYYASLYPAIHRGGIEAVTEEVRSLALQRAPSMLVIDGLTALRLAGGAGLEFQRFLHTLEALAAAQGMTVLLLAHPVDGDPIRLIDPSDPALIVADGIIALRTVPLNLREVRLLSVVKLRGTDAIRGWHTMEIDGGGLRVYPRIDAMVAADGLPAAVPSLERFEFAAEGLTEMMGGGLPSSTCTFVVGTPGSGKTFLGLAFLVGGLDHAQPSIFFGFHETPDRLLLKADGIGLHLRKGVERGIIQLEWRPPSELLSDKLADEILRMVDERGVRRLVIDGYEQFERGAAVGDRARDFFSAFCDVLKVRGVATVWTQDMQRIAGESFDLPLGDSQIVDSIIHVRSTELHAEFRRLIAILKVREQGYDRSIRELTIDEKGIRVGGVFKEGEALLTGIPQFSKGSR